MNDELKKLIEAILFAAARKLEVESIAKLCKTSEAEVIDILHHWKVELDEKNSPTMLIQEGNSWKLTVREKYIKVVKGIVTKTELPKSLLETLAVVAYKAPVMQSKVIQVRTNKAYDHLNRLEESGLISREKKGRSKLIRITPRFFEYFDIDPTKLKDKFGKVEDIEKAIENKEKESSSIVQQQQKDTKERLEKPQIELSKLKTYDTIEKVDELPSSIEVYKETMNDLEVFDLPKVPKENLKEENNEKIEEKEPPKEAPEEKIVKEVEQKTKELKPTSFEGKGLYAEGVSPDMEKKIDQRVKEILGEKEEE